MASYGSDLTGNGTYTASSGTASLAFDDLTSDNAYAWKPDAGVFPSWVQCQFSEPYKIEKVRIWSHYNSGWEAIKDFDVVASDTGSFTGEEVIIYTGVHPNETTNGFVDYTFTNNTAYSYYRIVVNSVYAGNSGSNTHIMEIEMMEALPINKILILSDGTYYKWDSTNGFTSVATTSDTATVIEDAFITHGMSSPISISKSTLSTLNDTDGIIDFENYTDDTSATSKTLNNTSVPYAQLIKPTGDIDLTNVDNIDSFTLTANIVGSGVVKVIVSVDSGTSWYAWDDVNLVWSTVDSTLMSDVKSKGMTPTVLNGVASADWSSLRGTSNTIRFAYYLEQTTSSDTANTDKLDSQFDMKGTWKHHKDADYEYLNSNLIVTVYDNGDYKINY